MANDTVLVDNMVAKLAVAVELICDALKPIPEHLRATVLRGVLQGVEHPEEKPDAE